MARYNEILVGRYNRFIQKLLGMKGPATMPQVAGEMQPVLPFFNGVENRILESWQRYWVTINQTAVAAQTDTLQIRNPAGSNVLAVVEQSTFLSNVAADTLQMNFSPQGNNPDLATTGQGLRMDSRLLLSSTCIVSNSAASVGQVGVTVKLISPQTSVMYQDILFEDHEYLLTPADVLRVTNSQANATVRWGLIWRERFLEESERVG